MVRTPPEVVNCGKFTRGFFSCGIGLELLPCGSKIMTDMETVKESTFDYLKTWDRPRLYARLEEIRPIIDFLLKMHNAGIKVAGIELAYLNEGEAPGRYSLHFDARGGEWSSCGFPEDLEIFIHNFCTFLCAEKWAIEFLIERGES
jgi:hypothetical protein